MFLLGTENVIVRRVAASLLGAALALLIAGCTLHERRLERRYQRAIDPDDGVYPSLDKGLFAPRARFTGVLRAERFNKIFGFWIFLQGPHREELTPVVLLHGHTTGPRRLNKIADALNPDLFEPWFCYYATGVGLERSALMLRQSLSATAERYRQRRVALVAYSHGGLIARQALRPTDDGVEMPSVPVLVAIAVPWGGSEHRRFDREPSRIPGSWEDIGDGSPFLQHLFDDPLPSETNLHIIYGLGGRDRASIPGEDDRILSERSLARREALEEAASVTVIRDARHLEIIEDEMTIALISHLLEREMNPSEPIDPTDRPTGRVTERVDEGGAGEVASLSSGAGGKGGRRRGVP